MDLDNAEDKAKALAILLGLGALAYVLVKLYEGEQSAASFLGGLPAKVLGAVGIGPGGALWDTTANASGPGGTAGTPGAVTSIGPASNGLYIDSGGSGLNTPGANGNTSGNVLSPEDATMENQAMGSIMSGG